jgi:putative CocE/NonD family hydrolase
MTRHELVRIAMTDGIELSATLFFPDGNGPDGSGPWPAVMEALPYRKDDLTAVYRPSYAELAEDGYVVCWLDVRGTGSSGGIATDEYTEAERHDLVEVIDWLATRDWSTGAVGMFGTSYGGFNSLQAALERPPALKAIVPIFASDDRYGDDVHYFGGVLKQLDVVDYPTYMVAMNALPPVPAIWGTGWRDEWDRRVDALNPWILTWLEHQRRDAYWRWGSAREAIEDIDAATMMVTGWADGYTNIAFRSLPRFRAPARLLMGPWAHAATETSLPGPNIRLTPEMVRWFDRWLKGIDNGIDQEPPIVVYAQRSTLPDPLRRQVRGTWRAEPVWPPARLAAIELALAKAEIGGLASGGSPDELSIAGDVGVQAWISCAGVMPWVQPDDQRPDEERSLTYTWEPLEGEIEILGHPTLRVRVTSSVPVAYLSAKVCDVFPDGSSSLVVRGLLNLTHRSGSADPVALGPGVPAEIELELEECSWTFEEGHRIRLDLAGADWPNAWTPPEAGTLTIDRATGVLVIPVLDGPSPATEPPILHPSTDQQHDPEMQADDGWWRREIHDEGSERRAMTGYGGDSHGGEHGPPLSERYEGVVGVSTIDPGRAFADGEAEYEIRYPEATVRSFTHVKVESERDAYHIAIDLVTHDGDEERHRRRWERTIPRDLQ